MAIKPNLKALRAEAYHRAVQPIDAPLSDDTDIPSDPRVDEIIDHLLKREPCITTSDFQGVLRVRAELLQALQHEEEIGDVSD